jgi:alkylhydroperoxidase domain protein
MAMSDSVIVHDNENEPVVFTQEELGWLPWLEPFPEAELTERHFAGLVDKARAKSDYFRLLVRDPEVLEARTKTDKDIFYNTADGLPRAERELAAAATSRYNGCIYCASVHSRYATTYSKRRDDVQRLLDEGVGADLGARWNAVVKASVALTSTPIAFGEEHIMELRSVGLDDAEIVDVINSASFFNWANRLMLSLGEPSK